MNGLRIYTILMVLLLASGADAQERPAPPTPPPAPAARPPAPPLPPAPPAPPAPRLPAGELVNIRIDVTIAEDGGAAPLRKTVSLTLADRQNGSVRSSDRSGPNPGGPGSWLNVDAFPMLQRNGKILTQVTLDYVTRDQSPGTSIRVQPLLESGKPLMVSQAASPTSDRRVSIEVTATVLK